MNRSRVSEERGGRTWAEIGDSRPAAWWGVFPLPEGEKRLWRIGPLSLLVLRSAGEWRLVYETQASSVDPSLIVNASILEGSPSDEATVRRIGFEEPPDSAELVPALPDRSLVVAMEEPLLLPPSERTTIYINIFVWMRVLAGPGGTVVLDTPLFRPSDTWFGPSTRVGELAYSSRSKARTELESLSALPHCAISAVHVVNQGASNLSLEQLRLPTQNLSLFETPQGRLWTERVTLVREADGEMAAVKIDEKPPEAEARLLAKARQKADRRLLIRAFGHIF